MMSDVSPGRRRQRRFHTPQFKAMVVESCFAPGVSMSSIARQFDLNATLLRRWVSDYERGLSDLPISDRQSLIAPRANLAQQDIQSESVGIAHGTEAVSSTIRNTDFLPIRVQSPTSAPCRVEMLLTRADQTSLHLTLSSATSADCVQLMREFLA